MMNKHKHQMGVSSRLSDAETERQRLCRPEELTMDWCRRSVENMQEYGN